MNECHVCQVPISDRGSQARYCDNCLQHKHNRAVSAAYRRARERRTRATRFCVDCFVRLHTVPHHSLCGDCRAARKTRGRAALERALQGRALALRGTGT